MEQKINAGTLRDELRILSLAYESETDTWSWKGGDLIRAQATVGERSNLFSRVGIGARDVSFVVRHRPALTLDHALVWKTGGAWEHCFLTAIIPVNPLYDTLHCARVSTVECLADYDRPVPGPHFPGVLTEKYVGHTQLTPLAVNTLDYVLVTPKCVTLTPGSLVRVGDKVWHVLLGHVLDGWKNEYEIERVADL